jgi:hypothetical protein
MLFAVFTAACNLFLPVNIIALDILSYFSIGKDIPAE